jgi:hypothetical protein
VPSLNRHQPTRSVSAALAMLVRTMPITRAKETVKINFLDMIILLHKKD